ncbi:MAG: AAA family ATPase, partial [Ilumatobacteraceae bacterium]
EAFRDQLSDNWLILPDVSMRDRRERQAEIVLVHAEAGVAVVEVKGHVPSISRGVWMAHGSRMDPQPVDQARDNSYALRNRLRSAHPTLAHLKVEYGVAFPNCKAVNGALPPGVHPAQILLSDSLLEARTSVNTLMTYAYGNSPIGNEAVQAIVDMLRPNTEFSLDPEARARRARARLEQICAQHVRVLERLDANRLVVVTGAAGTGKSRLVVAWAIRAAHRGERVLVTCYNDPLGAALGERLAKFENVTVGPFLRLARGFEGMPPLDDVDESDPDVWDIEIAGHLQRHWHRVSDRFDTIIIDEAQDFSPVWIAQLMHLLDPEGPRRVLMVADERQTFYERGFQLPLADDGWTHCELVGNCRNSFEIADLLRRHLGGARPPATGPEGDTVVFQAAATLDEAIDRAGDEVDRIVDADGIDPERVLFATFSRGTRDTLYERLGMVRWEERSEQALACETVRRSKGLEYDYVVLVAGPDDDVTDAMLYVGCSRAISGLTVIGPAELGTRLGL